MATEADLGNVAFHLVMAMVAEMAADDDERLEGMQQLLAGMLENRKMAADPQVRADLQMAYKAVAKPQRRRRASRQQ